MADRDPIVSAKSPYAAYQDETVADIKSVISELNCQPILFIGSGFSRRYFSGPSWDELLRYLAENCPLCDRDYAYYKQKFGSLLETGTELSELYFEWAWGSGKNVFPAEIYKNDAGRDSFIKHAVAERLKSIVPHKPTDIKDTALQNELAALKAIRPHAIITTNYDVFLDNVFDDYAPIVGQKILSAQNYSVGEILKIHGCASEPQSIVLTDGDYQIFLRKKKYLSAKLLTYLSEHPVLIAGYSAEDPNIRAILSDIDEALPISGDTIKNIYFLDWQPSIDESKRPAKEKLLAIEDGKSVRVRCVTAKDLAWVFEAFGSSETLSNVSPKILRSLIARSYELVRRDIPRQTLEADFEMLEGAVESSAAFAKLIGITTIQDPSHLTANYPYSLTELGRKLGYPSWHGANVLIEQVVKEKKFDLKASDNKYHVRIKFGKSTAHKYSAAALTLLKIVKAGSDYEV